MANPMTTGTRRFRVVFKHAGRVTWERTIIAESAAGAVARARDLALHLGIDVADHLARVEPCST